MIRTTNRLVVAATLFATGVAAAQPRVAPDPPPALDELVREYRRLGLPLPPPDAKLIRYGFRNQNPDHLSHLAFKTPPTRPGGWPRYWVGGRIWDRPQEPGHWEEPAGDGADGASGLEPGEHPLLLAIHCQAHGRGKLARALFELARAGSREREDDRTPAEVLRDEAWYYWGVDRLNVVGADRRENLRRLRTLVADDARFRTKEKLDLLGALEFTIESPPARPGTVEAAIDSLTEYAGDAAVEGGGSRPPHPGYWRLVEFGFDAVPALLAHLDDPRVTRWYVWVGGKAIPFRGRVGYVVAELLGHLAGLREYRSWYLPVHRVDTEKVRQWWAAARVVGEEKWLLDHVTGTWDSQNEFIIRTLRAKYPRRLVELYRTSLTSREPAGSWRYATEIRASSLPREQQVALFEEGARSKEALHRSVALDALGQIDPALIRDRVLRLARGLADDPKGARSDAMPAADVVSLVQVAADRACWDALNVSVPKLPVADRRDLIWQMGVGPLRVEPRPPAAPDPFRRHRVRILLGLLGDTAVDPSDGTDDSPGLELRDYAAYRLAPLVGFRPPYDDEIGDFGPDRERGPLTRLLIRLAVKQLAEWELSGPEP